MNGWKGWIDGWTAVAFVIGPEITACCTSTGTPSPSSQKHATQRLIQESTWPLGVDSHKSTRQEFGVDGWSWLIWGSESSRLTQELIGRGDSYPLRGSRQDEECMNEYATALSTQNQQLNCQ